MTLSSNVGDLAESDDDEKNGAELAEHILRDFNHDIRCKLMEKDRGLKVSVIFKGFESNLMNKCFSVISLQ